MKTNLKKRFNYVTAGEEAASNVEIIVWISVVLVIATVLFVFRDSISGFLTKATGTVNNLEVK